MHLDSVQSAALVEVGLCVVVFYNYWQAKCTVAFHALEYYIIPWVHNRDQRRLVKTLQPPLLCDPGGVWPTGNKHTRCQKRPFGNRMA